MDHQAQASHPAAFLKLISNPVRWQLLQALSKSDHTVLELVAISGKPDNLVSYHLGRLRDYHLVTERRGDADARDVYYSLDVEHLHDLYFVAGKALHPALGQPPAPDSSEPSTESDRARVLFLCTHNSARSQMAEALLRDLGKGRIEAFSAGTEPTAVRPEAVWAMAQYGLDISAQRSKSLEDYRSHSFDYVITVCDRAKESCPTFPGDVTRIHWSFPDPASVEGSEELRRQAFLTTALQLLTRIRLLATVIERDQAERPGRRNAVAADSRQ